MTTCMWASSAPESVDLLLVRDAAGLHGLLVNLTPELARVRVGPLPGETVALRILDDTTARAAATEPEAWRAGRRAVAVLAEGTLDLVLTPWAVVRLDAAAAGVGTGSAATAEAR